jgi:hypothetical protein
VCLAYPDNPNVIITGGEGPSSVPPAVTRSSDAGHTWNHQVLNPGVAGCVRCLAYAPSAPGTIVAAGYQTGQGAVYVSTDSGQTWTPSATAPAESVFSLAIHPGSPELIYAATSGGLYRSTDGGSSWQSILHQVGLRAVRLRPDDASSIYVGGDSGVTRSTNSGATWEDYSQGLRRGVVALEFLHLGDVVLYAGTAGGSVCRRNIAASTVAEQSVAPGKSEIRVMPNPVRNVALVNLGRDLSGTRPLRLRDLSGRLIHEFRPQVHAGKCLLDLSRIPAGVYWLETGFGQTRITVLH